MSSAPPGWDIPAGPHGPQAAAGAAIPGCPRLSPAHGRLGAGEGGRAAAHLPRGRWRTARRGQAPGRPRPRAVTRHCGSRERAARCRGPARSAGGWAQQEQGPTSHFAPGEVGLKQCLPRQAAASPSHYFFTARTIFYLINNSQVQTITFAVMVREPHVPGEGEGAAGNRYC